MNAEWKGIVVAAWDPKIITQFRERLEQTLDGSTENMGDIFAMHGTEIATELCKREYDSLSCKDRRYLEWLGILDKKKSP